MSQFRIIANRAYLKTVTLRDVPGTGNALRSVTTAGLG
jgi:hypothetical protein